MIKIENFKGESRRVDRELLPANVATRAVNCKLTTGALRAFHEFGAVYDTGVPNVRTIYRFGAVPEDDNSGKWFAWDKRVHAVRGPIGGNDDERTYYTGDGKPRMTYIGLGDQGPGPYPSGSYDLGVPAPAPAARPAAALVIPGGAITHIYGWHTGSKPTQPLYATFGNHQALRNFYHVIVGGITAGPTELNGRLLLLTRYYEDGTVSGPDVFALRHPDTRKHIVRGARNPYNVGDGGSWTLDLSRVDEVDKEDRFYVYTYVSALGEEGPPSPPSLRLEWSPGTSVQLTGMGTGPAAGNYNLDRKRIYRLATVDGQGAYQFAAEIPIGQTTFTDDIATADLGEVLQSVDWDPPPANLRNLLALPNGVLAGSAGDQLCLSVPNQPHAWPRLWRDTANHRIVALGNFDTTIVVCTEVGVYLAQGANPEGITLEDLNLGQGCVAAASLVSLGLYGVAFASPDGLVLVGPGGPRIMTEGWFDRDAWQALKPESIRGFLHDRRYFGFYDNGTPGGFIFDPAPDGMGLVMLDFHAVAGYSDPLTDQLYLVRDGAAIERFDDPARPLMPYTWAKRLRDLSLPANYTCAEVLAEDYSDVTARVYADGALKHTRDVTSMEPFRLPAGFATRDYEWELSGTSTVRKSMLAEDVDELVG